MIYPFEPYYVTVGFNGTASYGPHEGCDMNGPGNDCGISLKAIYDGEIIHTSSSDFNYGKLVVLKISGLWGIRYVRYCHQSNINVGLGPVKEGDLIGWLGNTGNSTACHLHFDMLKNIPPNNNWRFYSKDVTTYFEDPLEFIKKWKDVILIPPMNDQTKISAALLNSQDFPVTEDKEIQSIRGLLGDFGRYVKSHPDNPPTLTPTFNTPKGKLFYELAKLEG